MNADSLAPTRPRRDTGVAPGIPFDEDVAGRSPGFVVAEVFPEIHSVEAGGFKGVVADSDAGGFAIMGAGGGAGMRLEAEAVSEGIVLDENPFGDEIVADGALVGTPGIVTAVLNEIPSEEIVADAWFPAAVAWAGEHDGIFDFELLAAADVPAGAEAVAGDAGVDAEEGEVAQHVVGFGVFGFVGVAAPAAVDAHTDQRQAATRAVGAEDVAGGGAAGDDAGGGAAEGAAAGDAGDVDAIGGSGDGGDEGDVEVATGEGGL